ncbi:hypothetical protein O181_020334 [Austropuccinia psidii MF-1]|uniref:Uncharacterized protein n=1 Tax=Austropuccinia psidii MF-1 TaxID=1389203 RepID=A0A9Q3CB32_9BASI|nr:hypothetical protein [Austropuccinia psidii MF-1]
MFLPFLTQTHLVQRIAIDNIKTRISEEETSGVANTDGLVDITEGAAAGFLLRSIKQDSSLRSLVQNLYDIKTFTIKRAIKQLLAEHGRQTSGDGDIILNVNNSNNNQQNNKNNEPKLNSTNQVEEDSLSSVSDNKVDGSNGFLTVENDDYLNVVSDSKQTNRPVLVSGVSTSTVCNYNLLIDPKTVKM